MKKLNTKKQGDSLFNGIMGGIPTAYYLLFFLLPCLGGLYFSFTNFGGYSLSFKMVGWQNYIKLFKDNVFWTSVINYFKFYFGIVLICFPLSYAIAVILAKNKHLKEKNIYRVLYFFPVTVPTLIIAIMWMSILNPSFGALNEFLKVFGAEPVYWLGEKRLVLKSLIFVCVWRQFGFYLVYFLASVSNVPESLYESARIDGASEIYQVFNITIPLTWESIKTSAIFFIMNCVNLGFGTVYVMTQGGPDNASHVISSYMYFNMTKYLDYGLGSAMGVILTIITLSMSLILLKVFKRETYEF